MATALPDPDPVDELVAPELAELVGLVVVVVGLVVVVVVGDAAELVVPVLALPELVVVVVPTAALTVTVFLANAGSCPVMSTTAISDHTARNSATEAPSTRERIIRTRARLASRSLIPSSLVMNERIGAIRSTDVWAA